MGATGSNPLRKHYQVLVYKVNLDPFIAHNNNCITLPEHEKPSVRASSCFASCNRPAVCADQSIFAAC